MRLHVPILRKASRLAAEVMDRLGAIRPGGCCRVQLHTKNHRSRSLPPLPGDALRQPPRAIILKVPVCWTATAKSGRTDQPFFAGHRFVLFTGRKKDYKGKKVQAISHSDGLVVKIIYSGGLSKHQGDLPRINQIATDTRINWCRA